MRTILQAVLRLLSKLTLWKYKPIVIAITGSVGKTSTKEAIFAVLKTKLEVRAGLASYNNEIGVPLTILGTATAGRNPLGWLWIVLKGILMFIFPIRYPRVLILEMGADRPGDIEYLVSLARPEIAVVTAVGPSHLEFFGKIEKTAAEKAKLVEALSPQGLAILNYDEELVGAMARKSKGQVIFYGLSREAQLWASDLLDKDDGVSFKIHYLGNVVPTRLKGVLGKPAVYTALASSAVGLVLGLNLVEISRALASYQSPPGRLRLLAGIKSTLILDDSYNAAPASALAALEVLSKLPGKRKIAVLGDMTELGGVTEEGHRQVGAEVVDRGINFLVTVGARAKFIRDQAIHMGYPERQILSFDNADETRLPLQNLIKPGDVILVKGSRVMAMEKIVKEIMAEPERAGELLVH